MAGGLGGGAGGGSVALGLRVAWLYEAEPRFGVVGVIHRSAASHYHGAQPMDSNPWAFMMWRLARLLRLVIGGEGCIGALFVSAARR